MVLKWDYEYHAKDLDLAVFRDRNEGRKRGRKRGQTHRITITGLQFKEYPYPVRLTPSQSPYVDGNPISFIDPFGYAKIFGASSGQYEITTSSGKVFKNSSDSSQLNRDLQSLISSGSEITNITFRGHGGRSPNMITFAGGFITSSSTGIIDDQGNDIGASLEQLMGVGSEICVYGCNTARGDDNLANDINKQIPQSSVTGYRYYGIGGTNFGIHKTAGFSKTYPASAQSLGESSNNYQIYNTDNSGNYDSGNYK